MNSCVSIPGTLGTSAFTRRYTRQRHRLSQKAQLDHGKGFERVFQRDRGWHVEWGLASAVPVGLSLSPSSALVAPGDQLHARPYAGKKSRPFWCSELVYALTRLSVSLEDGLLTPSFLMPPSNSGENKWAIHAKREKKGEPGGGDTTDKLH